MMHAYGRCPGCNGVGALWIVRHVAVRRFWLFGKIIMRPIYRCDECDGPQWSAGDAAEGGKGASDGKRN
jgi:hypothetical protein